MFKNDEEKNKQMLINRNMSGVQRPAIIPG
jgi:hypothetical protein